ncbi:hypothetical protein OAA34_00310 [bacterium]|nr:hypothetical protein [bacterium]
MATVIKPKRSDTALSAPTTSDLAEGEIALNTADQIIYTRTASGIVKVANFYDPADSSGSFPTGDYGDLQAGQIDAFGQEITPFFDCLTDPVGSLLEVDLGALS